MIAGLLDTILPYLIGLGAVLLGALGLIRHGEKKREAEIKRRIEEDLERAHDDAEEARRSVAGDDDAARRDRLRKHAVDRRD